MQESLWNDTFIIKISTHKDKNPRFPVKLEEQFAGSLKSAIRYVLNKYPYGAASFYTSDGTWLKEIMW